MSLTTTTTTTTSSSSSTATATITTTISAAAAASRSGPTTASFSSTSTKTLPRSLRKRLPTSTRAGSGIASLSTPNLSSLFASHARRGNQPAIPPVPPLPLPPSQSQSHAPPPLPLLARKGSLAALTQSSLATIPDATEWYAFDTLSETPEISPPITASTAAAMAPLTPGRFASSMASYSGAPTPGPGGGDDISVGDAVDVPGGMNGTVRFVGTVAGRKGVFAGVELHPEFAVRGKNSGDVDGVAYFNTLLPGAGIFLPLNKAVRRDGSPSSAFPMTPTANGASGLKLGNQNSTNFTPPTPSLPKFSQSVSGGGPARAPSPQQNRRPPRTSLPRPDSPVRRLQMTPAPGRPSLSTPAPGKASAAGAAGAGAAAGPGRFGSPTSTNKFSQSMRAPATGGIGDPSKKGTGIGMFGRGGGATAADRKGSIGPRSASALGGASNYGDDDATPTGINRTAKTNGSASGSGSIGSASSFGQRGIGRPPSRTASSNHMKNGSSIATTTTLATSNDEEVERLRSTLEDRERQLKDQASTLADMESSLTELQTLIESSDGPLGVNGGMGGMLRATNGNSHAGGTDNDDERDLMQLRALLREKNDKIAMLTAEFDVHRADFRSTIDTLEMASTETERVYEKKIEEMVQEVQELESRLADVDAVAHQLKQLEELVQELEEGLEDARRGEAEARGELEFLRGEVERTRTELRREREKAAAMMAAGGGHPGAIAPGPLSAAAAAPSKELEQKDDEIRGLKAIIHSLSQNAEMTNGSSKSPSTANGHGSGPHRRGESINERLARETLEREVADLRTLLDAKSVREAEMERELDQLRISGGGSAGGLNGYSSNNLGGGGGHRTSAMTVGSRSSLRDSRGTVVLARDYNSSHRDAAHHGHTRSVSSSKPLRATAAMNTTTAAAAASSSASSGIPPDAASRKPHHARGPTLDTMPESDAYSSVTESSTLWCEICETNGHDILTCTNMFGPGAPTAAAATTASAPPALAPIDRSDTIKMTAPPPKAVPPEVKILPNPMESGPVAGKESGVVDAGKWCALCERDGHDSVDCPFEDAF